MAVRFRRRIKLLSGVHMNVSGSGASFSFGPRGASVSIGKRGVYGNTGVPGTGLYARTRLDGGGSNSRRTNTPSESSTENLDINVAVQEDGTILMKDANGYPLSPHLEKIAKQQQGEKIKEWLSQHASDINALVTAITTIHLETPKPGSTLISNLQDYEELTPKEPVPEDVGFLMSIFRASKAREIELQNEQARIDYKASQRHWERGKVDFERSEIQRLADLNERIRNDRTFMEECLSEQLSEIKWPYETLASFEVAEDGVNVVLDVDLPEIEDMPEKQANAPKRGWKLTIRNLSNRQKRINYLRHIHGIVFRLVGEVFGLLPSIETVVVSGYSQRPDTKTGQIVDEYLLSVKVEKEAWQENNFDNLDAISPEEALDRFELVRKMTKTGIFRAIEPITL